jgi:hypothetical protein
MKKRPVGITILAVFQLLNAVKKLAGMWLALGNKSTPIDPSTLLIAVFLLGLQVAIAIALLKGRSWARIFACIALTLRAIAGFIAIPTHPAPILMFSVCSVMIAIVVYLLASRKVREFFFGGDLESPTKMPTGHTDEIECSLCGFVQWCGYDACERCAVIFASNNSSPNKAADGTSQ